MLFGPTWMVPGGPLPQAVLNKRPCWQFLLVLLAITTILRFITLDIIGGILSALMLVMCGMMLSDGMQELPRYSLVFALLCVLCLFFDTVPLIEALNGRKDVQVTPLAEEKDKHRITVTVQAEVTSTPFFDPKQGFMYNGTSVAMLMSPVTFLLGAYLAIHAHIEVQRSLPALFQDEPEAALWMEDPPMQAALGQAGRAAAAGDGQAQGPVERPRSSLSRFQGVPHRLDETTPLRPKAPPPTDAAG